MALCLQGGAVFTRNGKKLMRKSYKCFDMLADTNTAEI